MLITGLGNPGPEYAETRHNVGFMVINRLSRRWDIQIDKRKFNGRIGSGRFDDQKVILQKPATFMNRSGLAVREAMDFYKLTNEDLLIIYDDLDLPTGQLRIRTKGSAGGHKGLTDVINHIGSNEIARIRIGIDSPGPKGDTVDYVLSRFSKEEQPIIEKAIEKAVDAVEIIIRDGCSKAMDRFNEKITNDKE